ncbi:MAG: phosphatase PAP2 family protein [Chitinophagaceae bacterium]
MTITGVLYSSAAGYSNRLRPMVYNSGTPMEKRILSEHKMSFFAGHVALVATSTFFMASLIAEYHPQSKFKWLYYSLAGAATVGTGYLRAGAGEHFPSDIILGAAVGTLSGLLTPALHKHKIIRNERLGLYPVSPQGTGLTMLYIL